MYNMRKLWAIVMIGCLVTMVFPSVTWGEESTGGASTAQATLTLDQAVNLALAKSDDLKSADYDIDRSKKVRDNSSDNIDGFIPDGNPSPGAALAFSSLAANDVSWQMTKLTRDQKADTLTTTVFQYYTNVLNNKEKVALGEKALENAQWQQNSARVGYEVGTASESGKLTAELNYNGKDAALNAAKANLEDSYQKLNDLVGLDLKARPVLTDDPSLVPVQVNDLGSAVESRVEQSPTTWLLDKRVDLAKIALDLFNWNDRTQVYQAKVIDLTQAELTTSSKRDQLRVVVRSLYQNLQQMEGQYGTLDQVLQTAQENLRIKKVQFDVGMATKGDLISAENDVASAEQALKSLVYQHELYKMYFDKPWTLSS